MCIRDRGEAELLARFPECLALLENLSPHERMLVRQVLTSIQLFHGCGIVTGIVPAAVTGLDMKIGGIVNQKQSLLRCV